MRELLRRRWQEAWRGMRLQPGRMALIAAPWLLGLLTVVPLLWYEADRALRTPERQAGHDAVQYAAQSMLRWLERLRDDTRLLVQLTPRLQEGASQVPLVETYSSLLRAGGDYHKVRWLDAGGHERLRLDQDEGRIHRVATAALQDKQGRPFFENALYLQPGQVHFSPLDLNVENGGIEQPLRPTLRASSPFLRDDGSTGVVVLNLHGKLLLERLREQARQSGFTLYLVHPKGYWLIGPEASDAWGWQLGHREHTVEVFDPALWRELQRQPAGHWRNWSFSTLEAAWGQGKGQLLEHADPTLGQLRVLVHRKPPQALRWQLVLAGIALLGMGMVAWVVLGQARALAREAAYVQRLRDGNAALALANERLQMAQQELARAERLSSLGLMVAGVAHEMNTPLASAQLALGSLGNAIATLQEQVRAGLRRSELEVFFDNAASACMLADNELRRSALLVQRFKQVAVDRAAPGSAPFRPGRSGAGRRPAPAQGWAGGGHRAGAGTGSRRGDGTATRGRWSRWLPTCSPTPCCTAVRRAGRGAFACPRVLTGRRGYASTWPTTGRALLPPICRASSNRSSPPAATGAAPGWGCISSTKS